jgi:hypothetical protein
MPATAATITGYADAAGYDAAVGSNTAFYDFNGLGPGIFSGDFAGVDFYTERLGVNSENILLNGYLGDAGDPDAVNAVGRIAGVFDSPVVAVAMNILSAGGNGVINLYDALDSWVGGVGYIGNGFVGVVTDMAFSRFEVVPAVFDLPGGEGYDRIFIDDFRFSTEMAPVPLPASGIMLLAAIGGLALRRRSGAKAT